MSDEIRTEDEADVEAHGITPPAETPWVDVPAAADDEPDVEAHGITPPAETLAEIPNAE
jgi:hypothetical protein